MTSGGSEPFRSGEPPVELTPLRPGLRGVLLDIVDPNLDGPIRPSRRKLAGFAVYLGAAAVYIAFGLITTDWLLSFWVCLGYLLVAAWLVPAGIRRLLR